jgi:hypothetical protein
MITLDRIRQLEPKLKDASDEEVAVIREYLYGLGHLMFETYQEEKGSKISVGLKKIDEPQ